MIAEKSLVFNFLLDCRKKEIDKWQRAIILREYLDSHSLSQRQLAEQLGIPKSTIEDWLLWGRLTKEEYKRLKNKGLNHTQIYRLLRDNKKRPKSSFVNKSVLDIEVQECIKKLKPYINNGNGLYTPDSSELLKELVNTANRILMKAERQ